MLDIKIEKQSEGRVRVALTGRLDTDTYAQCEKSLEPLLTPATSVLVFDLAGLEYLSSMGLRVLMKTSKVLASQGAKCILTRLQPPIRTVIDIARALPPENVFSSIEEADRYLDLMQRRTREKGSSASSSS